jgi:hypothetical protein
MKSSSILEDAVVDFHFSQKTSFTQIGTQDKIEPDSFEMNSSFMLLKASTFGFSVFILSR